MSTLFTISASWHDAAWLYEQLAFSNDGDAILLIENAVLATHSPLSLASFVAKCRDRGVTVYCLQDDMSLRGVDNAYEDINLIDYLGFVNLVTQHDKQVSW